MTDFFATNMDAAGHLSLKSPWGSAENIGDSYFNDIYILISWGHLTLDQDCTLPQHTHWQGVQAIAMWEKGHEPLSSYECFFTLFCKVFDHASDEKEAGE